MPDSRAALPVAPRLSVVIPAFNEVDNIGPLVAEVAGVLGGLEGGFEILVVDDASTDGTADALRALDIPALRAVFHRFNCGQSAAVASGFHAARGEWVATLDGDGQNDPADLPAMLARALAGGGDCVTGVRRRRQDNFVRRVSSRVANGFRNLITGDRVTDSGCGVRVVRRTALREVPVFNGMHRFLPTLLRGQGFSVIEHEVNHRERRSGVSKYGVGNRLWRGIRDCFGVRWYLRRAVRAERVVGERS